MLSLGAACADTNTGPISADPPTLTPAAAPAAEVAPTSFAATLTLSPSATRAVNRLLVGNNVQWTDNGDWLLIQGTTTFSPAVLDASTRLRPTVLRYPGGGQADLYRWRDGMGPLSERGTGTNGFTNELQTVAFGTAEFLELCARVGALPLITVNTVTGTASEAADWVRATNVTGVRTASGVPLGPVKFWEIGNEPYLDRPTRPDLELTPTQFAGRANEFIRAMRAVDPSISVALPMSTDRAFADPVLRGVTERIDAIALHNAYMPGVAVTGISGNDDALFRASMAAYRTVARDLDSAQALLQRYKPGQPISIAVTEYNALYTIGAATDAYINSLGGALYVADVLRLFAQTPAVSVANVWSLVGNWYFGALGTDGRARASYPVLSAFEQVLHGSVVGATMRAPTFANPAVGVVPAYGDTPLVSALVTREGATLRILAINKDGARAAKLRIDGLTAQVATTNVRQLVGDRVFGTSWGAGGPAWAPRADVVTALPATITLAPASLTWIELQLR